MLLRRLSLLAVLCSTWLLTAATSDPESTLYGYSAADSQSERQWETKFKAIPDPKVLRDSMQLLSARPHHVGSPYDEQNAQWILSKYKEWGWDAHIETFDVLFPTPKERKLELVAPTKFEAKLEEPALAVDPTSNQKPEQLPTYNAYSGDGDVTAPLVYVNFGLREDYEMLDRMGISVKGAIVIARYGRSWRGIKPKVAAEHGALGCLIYSDPQQDGYAVGDVFPQGGMRPKDGVQRGSVMDTEYPGDPLTPGYGSVPGAKRLPINEAQTILKIPVLPISYSDAEPLMTAITGRVAPKEWRGSLPITYHIGPGEAKVHLVMKSNWDTKPVRDVIAKIPGSEFPDEWILRGNHYDAWVNGAEDPISGQVAMLEEARAIGELLKQGWKPKRTIIYASWDGEEPGTLGSVEWVETHADELRQHGAVYINSDSNGRGFFYADGAHTLEHFINDVARDLQDPEKKIPVWDRSHLELISEAEGDERNELRERPDFRLGALGDGSDYVAFQDFTGISSLNLEYGDEDPGGIYHSIYDDFYWYTHFSDTDFVYGRMLAETNGTAIMRLADADVLPYQFTDFADTIHKYVDELQKLLKDKQQEAKERSKEREEGVYNAVSDPKRPLAAPPALEPAPFLNFAPLLNAADELTKSAQHYQDALKKAGDLQLSADSLKQLNATLIRSERVLTTPQGLPGRPWYKHQIYAPGAYTGYGVKTLPAIREPLEEHRYKDAEAA
ncbi:MAG TPA: transferrin receptor-like dimerization domain-containing protein, partial [Terriglobales bacterium]|nr:transferrin receptor-like dimerization domain-containing protein [Terriglobales bacterium]